MAPKEQQGQSKADELRDKLVLLKRKRPTGDLAGVGVLLDDILGQLIGRVDALEMAFAALYEGKQSKKPSSGKEAA